MKTSPLLFLLAITVALTLFLPGRDAQAAPPHGPIGNVLKQSGSNYACLVACREEFRQNVEEGKEFCEHCAFSIAGLCVAWRTSAACITSNLQKSEDIYDSCARDC